MPARDSSRYAHLLGSEKMSGGRVRAPCAVHACLPCEPARNMHTRMPSMRACSQQVHACVPCEPARNKYTHAFHARMLEKSHGNHLQRAARQLGSCLVLPLTHSLSRSIFISLLSLSLSLSLSLPPPSDVLCEQAREANHCSQTCGPHARALSMQFCLCLRARAGWRQGIAVI